MPYYVVDKVTDALNAHRKPLNGSRVLILGVAYKPDVDDIRESPALDVIHLLDEKGAQVVYHDPFVPKLRHEGVPELSSSELTGDLLVGVDCVVVVTNHSNYDWAEIAEQARLIVDTRNVTAGLEAPKAEIVRL
jgi:UDP-N-acetyl-D-glucosamine dehydrogenase